MKRFDPPLLRILAFTITLAAINGACDLAQPVDPAVLAQAQALLPVKFPAGQFAASAARDFARYVDATPSDPFTAFLAALQADPNVATAELAADHGTIIITLKNGEIISLFLDAKDRSEWTSSSPRPIHPDGVPPVGGLKNWAAGTRKDVIVFLADGPNEGCSCAQSRNPLRGSGLLRVCAYLSSVKHP